MLERINKNYQKHEFRDFLGVSQDDKRKIKQLFFQMLKGYNEPWVKDTDATFSWEAKFTKINQSLLLGVKNVHKEGIIYDKQMFAIYCNVCERLFTEKFIPSILLEFVGNEDIIGKFLIFEKSWFLSELKKKYNFNWFLVEISKFAPNQVFRFTLYPKNLPANEQSLKACDFFIQDRDTEKIIPPRYKGYFIDVLKFLNINPWHFKREFNENFTCEIKKRFPDFVERNENEVITVDWLIDLCSQDFDYGMPLRAYAEIPIWILMDKLVLNKQWIEFPKGSKICFFDTIYDVAFLPMESKLPFRVLIRYCIMETEKSQHSFRRFFGRLIHKLPLFEYNNSKIPRNISNKFPKK
jgi:hypothetical protein